MKKLLAAIVTAVLVAAMGGPSVHAAAESDIQVRINDRLLECDVPARIIENRTFLPMRCIFEALGARVFWIPETRQVHAVTLDPEPARRSVTLTIGEKEAIINGRKVVTDVAPLIVNGRTLVPVRIVAEGLGALVWWSNPTRTAHVAYRVGGESLPPEALGQQEPPSDEDFQVLPILFWAKDRPPIPAYEEAIRKLLPRIEQFFLDQTGKAFRRKDLLVVYSDKTQVELACGDLDEILRNWPPAHHDLVRSQHATCLQKPWWPVKNWPLRLSDEVVKQLGMEPLPPGRIGPENTIWWFFWPDVGGWSEHKGEAGGLDKKTLFGDALLSRRTLGSFVDERDLLARGEGAFQDVGVESPERAWGTILHETGHSFGLLHPPPEKSQDTVMGTGWIPAKLLPEERKQLWYSPFFFPLERVGEG